MNINDREMLHVMEHVINNPYMGVIYINTDCEILLVNETFADILGVDRNSIIGLPIQKVVPKSRLPQTVKTGEANLCELCTVNNKEMISMRVPIYSNGQIIGAMAKTLFLDMSTAKLMADMIVLNDDNSRCNHKYQSKYTLDDIVGNNRRMVRIKTWCAQVANNSSNVLIIGESGTGKELFAHAIHHAGVRRSFPFIRINCACIPENLIESELFGYEEGAFTGALKGGKKGKFELADKGTIFLDEIGEMPLSMQTKLLTFLQEREFERVGGSDLIYSDARIIAATNTDLEKAVADGRFREDLYYRLNVVTLMLPPLRDRTDDIEPLVNHIIPKLNNKLNTSIEGIEADALDLLINYHWPGNIRELENLLERAINLAHLDGVRFLRPKHFPTLLQKNTLLGKKPATLSAAVESLEYQLIINTLRSNNYNKSITAKQLDIHPSVLYRKLKKYNIS
ncbi:MAG TPA: sigma 54-interacting transcriptional regulator [Syntrophomonadaceae bacterium]|nr:sigma 54-interacting transcriptional regulator [Syntrophomonadaceae bacterium]HQE23367.1 sigma 54-interacting transcriptional regulator [Syntrophomonadaceae bacterium]